VVIVDRQGQIVAEFAIGHTAEGWQRWREQVAALGAETSRYVGRAAKAWWLSSYWKVESAFI
jgi:hypothetical protein